MKTNPILLAAVAFLPLAGTSFAASSTWNATAGGNFSDNASWTANVPGDASGTTSTDVATFARGTISATSNVTFDVTRNLGGITFDNTSAVAGRVFNVQGTTLGAATPALNLSNGFVLQNTGTTAAVSGCNTLDVAMVLNGNATFSNTYGNSVLLIGSSVGNSTNSITTATGLGAIDITLTGNSTGSNLFSLRVNQATGTTVRIVKEDTGFWQINGPLATAGNMTGGLVVNNGGVSIGRTGALAFGTGPLVLGDQTGNNNIRMDLGSSVNTAAAISVTAGSGNVIIQRGGGSGAGTLSGNISLLGSGRTVTFRQGTTANQALNISGNITGTGNIVVKTEVASAGNVTFSQSANMTGSITNNSTAGTGRVNFTGAIGSNVTNLTQASSSVNMTLSNAGNAYGGNTTISAGTILITGGGTLGNSSLVMSSGTLDITGATTGLTIASGKSVSGVGTIVTTGKTFTVNGALAPGASPGVLNVTGDINLGSTATTTMELAGAGGVAGTDFDKLNVSGAAAFDGSLSIVSFGGFSLDTVGVYDLFQFASFTGNFASVSVGATSLTFSGGLWTGTNGVSDYTFTMSTGDLEIAAVPEPTTWALVGLGLGATLLLRRRKA